MTGHDATRSARHVHVKPEVGIAAEGTSLTELLMDARMSTALTLLQTTTQAVSDIALSVGYDSVSRFALRFRRRFGFTPTAVRAHDHANGKFQPSSII